MTRPDKRLPPIGALLRTQWEVVRDRQLEDLHEHGFADLAAQHIPVLQWPGPHGTRPSQVAARLGMSKQALNYLLGDLQRLGYIERHHDPADRRSRKIVATDRGLEAMRVMWAAARSVEREWARRLGATEAAELRALLTRLAEPQ
jgi:DNA-binding MarR family transcriptional regulator